MNKAEDQIEEIQDPAAEPEEKKNKGGRPPKARLMECIEKCLYKNVVVNPGTQVPAEYDKDGKLPCVFKAVE